MHAIWTVVMIACCVVSIVTGNAENASEALMQSGNEALQLLLTLLASMMLWSGLMEILNASGDLDRLGKLFRRVLGPLFPSLHDEAAWSDVSMNLSANLLGLGNAATPAGTEAAKRLAAQGEQGMQALAMLLVMNNAGLQMMPSTVISMRQAAGASSPASIWLPTLIVSGVSMLSGVMIMLALQRGGTWGGRIRRCACAGCGAHHCSQGRDERRGHI